MDNLAAMVAGAACGVAENGRTGQMTHKKCLGCVPIGSPVVARSDRLNWCFLDHFLVILMSLWFFRRRGARPKEGVTCITESSYHRNVTYIHV